ncbi:hypothetical protein [uncultured Aquimarina sp.]|uniref:hypothetical protein n=1 Tax=uncultured Aquimarina sp. TaxID=575652 RepID=UPI00262F0AE0|nr:hypothetical protein [uncultured Aquimarina sp.]
MIEKIKETAGRLSNHLQNVEVNGVKQYYKHDLDCAFFQDWNLTDIRVSAEHKSLFIKLSSLSGPVVYWFEIISPISNKEIRKRISDYKFSDGAKSVPALKKIYSQDSRTLYVGKVKRNFWGRIIQHLGYYHVKRTQGLQLYHWAKEIGLKVRLHAYEFEPEMEDLVSIFELKFARTLNPITGKHS